MDSRRISPLSLLKHTDMLNQGPSQGLVGLWSATLQDIFIPYVCNGAKKGRKVCNVWRASLFHLLGTVLRSTRAALDISPKLQHVGQAVDVKTPQPLHFL